MKYFSRTAALALIAVTHSSLGAPEKALDLLRFTNNDTLHGNFISFSSPEAVTWSSPEAAKPITFSTSKLHRIILNRGQAHQALKQKATVQLSNGDIIPGSIISADDQTLVVETEHLGRLQIPRTNLSKISPNPFGGKLLYYGPLNTNGWKTLPTAQLANAEKSTEKAKKDDTDALTDWQHIGAAWYAGTDKTRFLVRENAMPDKCRLNFKLAWRGTLYTKIALHADFSPPEYENKVSSQLDMGATVGHAYMLSISSHSASLYSCTFAENGKPINTRLEGSQSSLGLSGEEEANVELRIDRDQKNILLFLNGSFKAKWHLGDDYAGKGEHLAFLNLRYSKSEIRISDVVISHWNGMKDSASSMKSADRDVILLNNGLDRFSGSFKELRNGKIYFKGSFDNEMIIPMDEISEIYIASDKLKPKEDENPKDVYFYIYPHGRITGVPSLSNDGKTKLQNSLLGEIILDTRYINLIDFSHKNSLLDNWDDNF